MQKNILRRFTQAEKSGSVALDLHIHDVDFMRYILGEPESFATLVTRGDLGNIEQIFTNFKYPGCVVSIEGSWEYPQDFPFTAQFRVIFDDACVVYDETFMKMKNAHVDEYCPNATLITKEKVEKWHEDGFSVRAWGVINEELMKMVYDSGADGMTVNFPDKLRDYINQ